MLLLALSRDEGLLLVIVKAKGLPVFGEVWRAVGLKDAALNQLGDSGSRFVGGIELEEGICLQLTPIKGLIYKFFDSRIANFEKAFDVAAIVLNDFVAKFENI